MDRSRIRSGDVVMLQSQVLEGLVIGLAVVTVALLVAVVVLALRLRRLAADQRRAFDGVELDVLAALARHTRRLDGIDDEVASVREHSTSVRSDLRHALSRIGVVRYDAFENVGGELSFSLALLDEHDDGLVMSSINGRSDGRTYLKVVTGGTSESQLSDEERTAIEAAAHGRREERVTGPGSRRWRKPR
jgi:hypothetical protein